MIIFICITVLVILMAAFGEVAVNDYRDMKEQEKDEEYDS